MPIYKCSYAYDVPHYADFAVRAKNEREAKRIIEKALKDKKFDLVTGNAFYDELSDQRVFVSGPVSNAAEAFWETTLEQLIENSKKTA